ncbi:hypothetical protein [Candidatus Pseudothioglobus sp. Uisw_086]|uniref:hypothetical protein n=1 Tax=Candidatus Pseudothioglobus sp. Uisw_086 TaxID=3230998 RepID=UPI003A85167E
MSLAFIYRLNGLLGLFWASSLWFGADMMAAAYGWEVTRPMITMAQLLGTSFFFTAIVFLMLPNWTSERQLKKATKTLILLQFIFLTVQVFHIYTKAIPSGGMQYFGIGLSSLFIILFYWKSRA